MKPIKTLLLVAILINLSACQTINHNLIPHDGPTMEQVYDGVGKSKAENADYRQTEVKVIRKSLKPIDLQTSSLPGMVSPKASSQEFKKAANPEIKMYLFPHLASVDELPIPGYITAMSLYPHDHYALQNEGE